MSKKGLNLTFCIILIFVFLITASAHPGRTDKNGGHYNRSTGEYHYHTGEYAGRSQSSSSSQSTKSNNSEATLEAIERLKKEHGTNTSKSTTSQKEKKNTFWDVAKIILGLHIGFFPFVIAIYSVIFEYIGKLIRNRKNK